MKFVAASFLSLTLMMSVSAHAILRAPGSFVPSQCGAQEAVNTDVKSNIIAVCVGSISVEGTNAVEFRMQNGESRIFRVTQKDNLLIALRSGNVKSNIRLVGQNGEQASMRVIENEHGEVSAASGELDGEQYLVTDFRTIFTIQDAE